LHHLRWLPSHPDIEGALSSMKAMVDPAERLLSAASLANVRRDMIVTGRIDRAVERSLTVPGFRDRLGDLGFVTRRVALLASHSVEHLVPSIRVSALGRGLVLEVSVSPYGQYRQILLEEPSLLDTISPQIVIFALDEEDLHLDLPLIAAADEAHALVIDRIDGLRDLWRLARQRYGATVIQQTLMPSSPSLFGSLDFLVPAAPATMVAAANTAIRQACREDGVLLLDLPSQVSSAARLDFNDPVRWHHAKQIVSPLAAPLYGDLVARVIAANAGLSKKCLVLDLDNTIWGGVIGDDGPEGIALGAGDPTGEAFVAFQRYAVQLMRRGVMLAICSKNDPAIAEAGFSHADMIIKKSDVSAFVANWEDKATNLRRIAQELNIGIDSLVFVDDNPAERDIVRRELPMVAVPEMPDDVAYFPAVLAQAGFFEATAFTVEDANRSKSYSQERERKIGIKSTTDMEGFLRGLNMTMQAGRVSPRELARVTQLINKTNQFNLTTRRYTEAEIGALLNDPDTLVLHFRLSDRFGDHGLIAAIIARSESIGGTQCLQIDNWLMSCRVLGRGVEAASFDVLTKLAADRAIHTLVGEYRRTARNDIVCNHYAKLGFKPMTPPLKGPTESGFWQYEIVDGQCKSRFIKIEIA
jgi:FkbH-like protein